MKAVLFDLDGTLLPMDTDSFMKLYAQAVTEKFSDYSEAEEIFPQIMNSVGHVIMSREDDTNYNKFFKHFEEKMPRALDAYIPRFNEFYEDGFHNIKPATSSSSDMIEAVEILKNKGYELIIATNPIFPMRANEQRIAWAGLDINDFKHITSFEVNCHCKPFVEFYQEVLRMNNLEGHDVLMVGNDVQEDLTIRALGAKTYIINNHIINRKPDVKIPADHVGSYKDFLEFVKGLNRSL